MEYAKKISIVVFLLFILKKKPTFKINNFNAAIRMDEDRLDRLKEKIESGRKNEETPFFFPGEKININHKQGTLSTEAKIFKSIKELEFLNKLLRMIEHGATGFELAHVVQKYNKIKKLINNGIKFYNTFTEIGELIFLEAPDKKEKDYSFFKTVENTEKYIFMVWIRDEITKGDKYFMWSDFD